MFRKRNTFTSCSDLIMWDFVQIVVRNKLDFLYSEPKSITNTNHDLTELWDGIFSEYQELSNDTSGNHLLDVLKEITVLTNKIKIINECVALLITVNSVEGYEPTINILKEYGFYYTYSDETIKSDCQSLINAAKTLLIELQDAQSEYENISKSDNKEATEQDYLDIFTQLSHYNHFEVDPRRITVSQYISYLNAFKRENK